MRTFINTGFICIIILTIAAGNIFAAEIKGTVTDKETGESIPGAVIKIENSKAGAITNIDGEYLIANAPDGEFTIIVTMTGYKTEKITAGGGVVDITLEIAPFQTSEIVSTATRTPRVLVEVPVRTEIVTSAEIKEGGAVNVYDALEGITGVRVEQQCSYCNFSVVRMQGLESGHVQMLIDGQPIFSGLAGVYGLQQIPVSNIERIEVVKGAGSALYGSNAIAGVINVITKKPTLKPTFNVSTSFGSHNTNTHTISASTRAEDIDVMITAQKNTGDEIDENDNRITDRVKTDNTAFGARINWHDISGNDRITLIGRTTNEFRMGGELDTWESPYAAGAEHIKTARYETSLGYNKTFAGGSVLSANLAYNHHDRNATNDTFLGDYEGIHNELPPVDEMEPYAANENLYVLDVNYSHALFDRHQILGGLLYSHNKLEETGMYISVDDDDPNYGEPYKSKSEKFANEIGLYIQDEFSIRDNLEMVIGARFDKHNSEDEFAGSGSVAPKMKRKLKYDENSFNPRFAIKYKPLSNLYIRGSAGTGFRVPYGFSEDLHLCSGSPRVNKPGDLEPEKSVSMNLGADYIALRYMLSASIFRTNLENKIGLSDAGDMSKKMGYDYEWENIGNAYSQGIELAADIILKRSLEFKLDFGYTDAQYEKERADWVSAHGGEFASFSKYIPRVPETTGGIKFTYKPGEWNASINANYTGKMYIDYYEDEDIDSANSKIKHTDGFFVTNIRLSRHIHQYGITPFLGARNLFDYVQDEKHYDDAAFMYAPFTGRIVYGGVEIEF